MLHVEPVGPDGPDVDALQVDVLHFSSAGTSSIRFTRVTCSSTRASVFAPFRSSSSATALWPLIAADMNGVTPIWSTELIVAPAFTSSTHA